MKLLLDFDGVLITTPSWRKVARLDDGFLAFKPQCAYNIAEVVTSYSAEIVLTTTHRIHYDNTTWQQLLENRGIITHKVSKINEVKHHFEIGNRCDEIMQWVEQQNNINNNTDFIIIDDDKSLNNLLPNIKNKWIQTDFMLGFTDELKEITLQNLKQL